MNDELRLFDAVVDQALGESLDSRMRDYAAAIQRGDGEQTRLLDGMIRLAITLGYHAVVAETWKSSRT